MRLNPCKVRLKQTSETEGGLRGVGAMAGTEGSRPDRRLRQESGPGWEESGLGQGLGTGEFGPG